MGSPAGYPLFFGVQEFWSIEVLTKLGPAIFSLFADV